MTALTKTRYSKTGTRELKIGSKVTRIPVKERAAHSLKIKKEEYREKGQEAARVLNKELKKKEEARLEAIRKGVTEGEEQGHHFDSEEYIQDYHRTQVAQDIYMHTIRLQELHKQEDFEGFLGPNSPWKQFYERWKNTKGFYNENSATSKEMKRIQDGYDKLRRLDKTQREEEYLKWKHGGVPEVVEKRKGDRFWFPEGSMDI